MKNPKIIVLLLVIGFTWSFTAGILLAYLIFKPTTPPITPPIKERSILEEYDIMAVSEATPHVMLVFDLIKDGEWFYGSVHYFDGADWQSQALSFGDEVVKPMSSHSNLISSIDIETSINKNKFIIHVPQIATPMAIRAQKDYVKFGGAVSEAADYLVVNGQAVKSYVALLKGYNFNYVPEDIKDLGVQTDWLMFWGKDFNFYHLDKTEVLNPSPYYNSHEFFSTISRADDNFGRVSYFSDVSIRATQAAVAVNYTENGAPRSLELNLGPIFKRYGYEDMALSVVASSADGGIGVYTRLDTAGVGY